MSKRQRVTVESVSEDDGEYSLPPFVAYYAQGSNPQDDDYVTDSCDFEVYEKFEHNRGSYAIVGRQGCIDYVGTSRGSHQGRPPCRYALGVYNKDTGKLQVTPIAASTVLRLEPRVVGFDYRSADDSESEDEDNVQNKVEGMRLVGNFGSTRRRRQITQREDARVQSLSLASTVAVGGLQAAALEEGATTNVTREQLMKAANEQKNIPPHHPEATKWHDAYRINELVPRAVWDSLPISRMVSASKNPEEVAMLRERGWVPEYILARLVILQEARAAAAQLPYEEQRRARCLAFTSVLLQMHLGHRVVNVGEDTGGLQAAARKRGLRQEVFEPLLETFYLHSEEGGQDQWLLSTEKAELLLGYVLVSALLSESGSMSGEAFEALRVQLKIDPQGLASRFRELGAAVTPVQLQDRNGPTGGKAYQVQLLMGQEGEPQTLKDCFPALKLGPPPRGKK